MKVKVKKDALEIHEKLIPSNPSIPNGKQKYASFLSEVVGETVEVIKEDVNKFGKGYVIRTPKSKKKIMLSPDFVDLV